MNVTKPKLPVGGLAQGPNDLDKPAGDFLLADNVVHRRSDILEPIVGEQPVFDIANVRPVRIFSDWAPKYSLRITSDDSPTGELSYGESPVDSEPITFGLAEFRPGETQCTYTDGRHILSGADYVVVLENETETTHGDPRRAGLPQVAGISIAQATGTAGTQLNPVVPASKVCAYTALVRREIVGDRFLYSAPCSKISSALLLFDCNYQLIVFFETVYDAAGMTTFQAGDEILLFRTKSFDSIAEINDTYYLSTTYKITAVDLTVKYATIRDNTLESNLGMELYTNPGQEGSLKTNLIPPACSGVETYNGTQFYVNHNAQPNVTITATGSFGQLPIASSDATRQQRANGIGVRNFTGTYTSGSPNVTGISVNDRVGLAVGQFVYSAHTSFVNPPKIIAITGAGPYGITLDALASSTGTDLGSAHDAFRITGYKDGVSTVSDWGLLSSLDAVQFATRDLVDLSANAMRGFVVNCSGVASIFTGSVYSDRVQLSFSTVSPDQWDSFDLTVTNPDNWAESDLDAFTNYKTIASVQELRKNVVWYSKPNQPEHVSPIQFILIGAGTVHRLLNVQSCMLALCSDGLFKVEGEGDNWFISTVDSAARLVHPDCVVANSRTAFAWLESGMSLVTETGSEVVSRDAIGPNLQAYTRSLFDKPNGPHYLWGPCMAIDRLNNEVYLNVAYRPATDEDLTFYAGYILNTQTAKFTGYSTPYSALCYSPAILGLLRGQSDGLYTPSTLNGDYKVATVLYLPAVDDAGEVKQWLDVNYFFDEVPASSGGDYTVEALFGGEVTSTTNVFAVDRAEPRRLFALHSLVPRRSARDVELIFGFRTSTDVDETHPSGGFYFEFKGASVRVRRASQLIKR